MGISKHHFHHSRSHNTIVCRQTRAPGLHTSLRQSNGLRKDNECHHRMCNLIEDVHHQRATGLCSTTAKTIITLRHKLHKVALVATSYSQLILVHSRRLNDPRTWTINH